jgi:hypothetical protein
MASVDPTNAVHPEFSMGSAVPGTIQRVPSIPPLPAAVIQAELLEKSASVAFENNDFNGMANFNRALRELVKKFAPFFKGDRETSHFNAALGGTYLLETSVAVKFREPFYKSRELAVQYLTKAVETTYHHPREYFLKCELAFQAQHFAKEQNRHGHHEDALRLFTLAADALESLLCFTENPRYLECVERCGHAHTRLSGVYHALGMEQERIPHSIRGVQLFGNCAGTPCDSEHYLRNKHQQIFQQSILGSVYEFLGEFSTAITWYDQAMAEGEKLKDITHDPSQLKEITHQIQLNQSSIKAIFRKQKPA